MDRELRDRWVAALRSGKYEQGVGYLRARDCERDVFCCLGVLCDIHNAELWNDNHPHEYSYDGNSCELPEELSDAVGISDEVESKLICFNDGEQNIQSNPEGAKYTFAEIADWIEANL